MARNSVRISGAVLVITFIITGVMFLVMPESITGKFHDVFIYVLGPVLKIGPESKISDLPAMVLPEKKVSYASYEQLKDEYSKLQASYKILQRKFLYLHEKYEQVSGARQRLPDVGPGQIWAEVVRCDLQQNEIDINRGRSDGLKKGQYVIGQDVLVGTVASVNNYSAKVRLLTSEEHELIVEIEAEDSKGTKIYRRAIMKGDGSQGCLVAGIQTNYKITKDNFVYAYARPGYLNSPLIIGKVSEIEYDSKDPLMWKIRVKPSFDLMKLDKIFVVTMEETEGIAN